MRMFNDWMVVRSIKEEKSKGGIFLPGTADQRLVKAEVIVPPEKEKKIRSANSDPDPFGYQFQFNYTECVEENDFKIDSGDYIIYDALGGVLEIEVEGEKYDLVNCRNLVAHIDDFVEGDFSDETK